MDFEADVQRLVAQTFIVLPKLGLSRHAVERKLRSELRSPPSVVIKRLSDSQIEQIQMQLRSATRRARNGRSPHIVGSRASKSAGSSRAEIEPSPRTEEIVPPKKPKLVVRLQRQAGNYSSSLTDANQVDIRQTALTVSNRSEGQIELRSESEETKGVAEDDVPLSKLRLHERSKSQAGKRPSPLTDPGKAEGQVPSPADSKETKGIDEESVQLSKLRIHERAESQAGKLSSPLTVPAPAEDPSSPLTDPYQAEGHTPYIDLTQDERQLPPGANPIEAPSQVFDFEFDPSPTKELHHTTPRTNETKDIEEENFPPNKLQLLESANSQAGNRPSPLTDPGPAEDPSSPLTAPYQAEGYTPYIDLTQDERQLPPGANPIEAPSQVFDFEFDPSPTKELHHTTPRTNETKDIEEENFPPNKLQLLERANSQAGNRPSPLTDPGPAEDPSSPLTTPYQAEGYTPYIDLTQDERQLPPGANPIEAPSQVFDFEFDPSPTKDLHLITPPTNETQDIEEENFPPNKLQLLERAKRQARTRPSPLTDTSQTAGWSLHRTTYSSAESQPSSRIKCHSLQSAPKQSRDRFAVRTALYKAGQRPIRRTGRVREYNVNDVTACFHRSMLDNSWTEGEKIDETGLVKCRTRLLQAIHPPPKPPAKVRKPRAFRAPRTKPPTLQPRRPRGRPRKQQVPPRNESLEDKVSVVVASSGDISLNLDLSDLQLPVPDANRPPSPSLFCGFTGDPRDTADMPSLEPLDEDGLSTDKTCPNNASSPQAAVSLETPSSTQTPAEAPNQSPTTNLVPKPTVLEEDLAVSSSESDDDEVWEAELRITIKQEIISPGPEDTNVSDTGIPETQQPDMVPMLISPGMPSAEYVGFLEISDGHGAVPFDGINYPAAQPNVECEEFPENYASNENIFENRPSEFHPSEPNIEHGEVDQENSVNINGLLQQEREFGTYLAAAPYEAYSGNALCPSEPQIGLGLWREFAEVGTNETPSSYNSLNTSEMNSALLSSDPTRPTPHNEDYIDYSLLAPQTQKYDASARFSAPQQFATFSQQQPLDLSRSRNQASLLQELLQFRPTSARYPNSSTVENFHELGASRFGTNMEYGANSVRLQAPQPAQTPVHAGHGIHETLEELSVIRHTRQLIFDPAFAQYANQSNAVSSSNISESVYGSRLPILPIAENEVILISSDEEDTHDSVRCYESAAYTSRTSRSHTPLFRAQVEPIAKDYMCYI